MKINDRKMANSIEEKIDQKLKDAFMQVRSGMVMISDGKNKPEIARLLLTMEVIKLQRPEQVFASSSPANVLLNNQLNLPPSESKQRMVQITRQMEGGLGLSIKGGAEHKLPILISRIYKNQPADRTGQLFVGDAIIKVNGEFITACNHDDAVNILRNAGDMVVLTVKHYRAATPFLQKQLSRDTPESDNDNDATCTELKQDEGWRSAQMNNNNDNLNGGLTNNTFNNNFFNNLNNNNNSDERPESLCSEPEIRWVDIISVPLMMAYVTRYIYGTDKLRANAFEVRGLNASSTGVIHLDDLAILSSWLKYITDNVVGLTNLQMKLYNRNFAVDERIEYMGWVNESVLNSAISWQTYKPRFLVIKGTEVFLFDNPPINIVMLGKPAIAYKIYQTMFRVVKESETVDSRQHCFLLQSSGHDPLYLSVETRQELLRIENSWNAAIVASVIKLGRKTFAVSHQGRGGGLTLDWQTGFCLAEGADPTILWKYKFSQLRGSSDDGKSKLKLHFQDLESRSIETKELECQVLQSLLFCMHAFLTAKVASVDPQFLNSIQQT
ncbi:CLUMA_CG006233, isoform A [Clunio marinus]|uniref:CLUMA_CG006233, isoform A n=1 Tax=Clunio marinus TaxID=568069 RepID=A0A1J1HZD9_9DIPT|nr:CLUMA_CG006233, isoform A [Clunio marinus]